MTFGRGCQGDGKQAVISREKEVRKTGGREGAVARGSSRQKDNEFSWRTGSCECQVDTSSQSQLQNFELEQVPLLLVQGKQSYPGRGGRDGENGFLGTCAAHSILPLGCGGLGGGDGMGEWVGGGECPPTPSPTAGQILPFPSLRLLKQGVYLHGNLCQL